MPQVRTLVLDATPLITHPYAHYQRYADEFYTTPTVFHEIRDATARQNLEVWQSVGALRLKHPGKDALERVTNFARLTGDSAVLSANDLHILALAYELEAERNGTANLRLKPVVPGSSKSSTITKLEKDSEKQFTQTSTKKKRRGGRKQRAKREAEEQSRTAESNILNNEGDVSSATKDDEPDNNADEKKEMVERYETSLNDTSESDSVAIDIFDDEDDGEWITPENLTEAMIKDNGEDTTGEHTETIASAPNQVALATGDFAVQNVAIQMNINLMNFTSGLKINRVRNYRMRCHACFQMFPCPRNNIQKLYFCPSCGGQGTVIRCAVSVDAETGELTPHLKKNFQWNTRGTRYSVPSPLSRNYQRKYGKGGYQHSRHDEDTPILREDQREYAKAMKQQDWTQRHNEKVLNDWIAGGSADNIVSPFAITGLKHHSVRIGTGRHVNASRKKR